MRTAKTLGLTVQPLLLAPAHEAINETARVYRPAWVDNRVVNGRTSGKLQSQTA